MVMMPLWVVRARELSGGRPPYLREAGSENRQVAQTLHMPHHLLGGLVDHTQGFVDFGFHGCVQAMSALADLSSIAYRHTGAMSNQLNLRFGRQLRVLRPKQCWTQAYMADHVCNDSS